MSCPHSPREYFYSVYTNKRICRHCWTDEDYNPSEEPMSQFSTAAQKPTMPPVEDLIDNMMVAMARISEEAQKADEAVADFVKAHTEGQERGIGVVVVRNRDGSVTSTPNVFVKPGTAIFMDEPGDWSQSIRDTPAPRFFNLEIDEEAA